VAENRQFTIRLEVEDSDVWAVNRWLILNRPENQGTLRALRLFLALLAFGPLGCTIGGVLNAKYSPDPSATLLMIAPFALGLGALGWRLAATYYLARVRPTFMANKTILLRMGGEREITVSAEGARDVARGRDTLIRWSSVTRVVDDVKHVYILASDRDPIVIPKRVLSGPGEVQSLLDLARTRGGTDKTARPVVSEAVKQSRAALLVYAFAGLLALMFVGTFVYAFTR
jgi:hypothetical protein